MEDSTSTTSSSPLDIQLDILLWKLNVKLNVELIIILYYYGKLTCRVKNNIVLTLTRVVELRGLWGTASALTAALTL